MLRICCLKSQTENFIAFACICFRYVLSLHKIECGSEKQSNEFVAFLSPFAIFAKDVRIFNWEYI